MTAADAAARLQSCRVPLLRMRHCTCSLGVGAGRPVAGGQGRRRTPERDGLSSHSSLVLFLGSIRVIGRPQLEQAPAVAPRVQQVGPASRPRAWGGANRCCCCPTAAPSAMAAGYWTARAQHPLVTHEVQLPGSLQVPVELSVGDCAYCLLGINGRGHNVGRHDLVSKDFELRSRKVSDALHTVGWPCVCALGHVCAAGPRTPPGRHQRC